MKTLRPGSSYPVLALVAALAACSSSTMPGDDAGRDVATDAAVDAPVPTDAAPSPCPATAPANGAPCTRSGLLCEYGDDPRRECRVEATCSGTSWSISAPADRNPSQTWCAQPPPAAMCPATLAMASGQSCSALGAVCNFAGLTCECTNCTSFPVGGCGGSPRWQCDATPPAAGCPASSPRFGESCTQEGLDCEYGCNSPNGAVRCTDGVWQRGSFEMCPISERRFKRDIAYLRPEDTDALAAQVRATRLATYEYTIPAMSGRRRLGFILDDQPHSFAADPEHSQVDLYGFTSMLVATVQSQDRTIAALRGRVEALERSLARRGPRAR